MAFAKQKLHEVVTLRDLVDPELHSKAEAKLIENRRVLEDRKNSSLIHKSSVRKRLNAVTTDMFKRNSEFAKRQKAQSAELNLPEFPTTTIGSFPQTKDVRKLRRQYKKNEISQEEYEKQLRDKIREAIGKQEEVGLDVLVHGEFERN